MTDSELTRGWQLHQAGQFAAAARCYHAVLTQKPDHAGALHLFGLLHHQNGYFERAVELIGRAVAARSGASVGYRDLPIFGPSLPKAHFPPS